MDSTALRQSFLDFFASKGHHIVPSASLLPGSPNLLFTNAGMNQFVPYFLGERPAPWPRAADTQKCIRAGGKHNDLEDVGFDTYHHTFFEMLGNWSFGDYFKREAIEWAWELLTRVWKLPKERLYVSVYQPGEGDPADFDQEAYDFWKVLLEKDGLDPQVHIVRGNKKDNFWMMGETGPCGPCSEIHIDLTPKGDSKGKLVNADSPYCIEIWNLVFIQFNAEADGSFQPLKAKHIDTGMGFERVAGIFATSRNFTDFSRVPSNYDSDLFQDIFAHISARCGHTYGATLPADRDKPTQNELNDVIFRVLADHIRTLSFSIADGILPGNEGRNYVLRRILRRAVMFGKRLGLPSGFFADLAQPLIAKMGGFFPELVTQKNVIVKVLTNEEQAFDRTLDRGLKLLDEISAKGNGKISGEEAFTLYDTYGFPLDLTELIARERGLQLDKDGFEAAMEAQRARARAAQKRDVITLADDASLRHSTEFVGYCAGSLENVQGKLLDVLEGDGADFLITDKSPFYAEMGGQVGDTGLIVLGEGNEAISVQVLDTVKDDHGHQLHKVAKNTDAYRARIGQSASLSVDTERRREIQRHHSATHILNYALRDTLGTHIVQAGSLVQPGHLRFDFTHFEGLSPEQIERVEAIVNERILTNAGVETKEIPIEEKPAEVIATFGEKYGAKVRVVDIGGFSKELCGGTHVAGTGEIGLFKVVSESAIAAGTRRIEAVCGQAAVKLAKDNFAQLRSLARDLHTQPAELAQRIEKIVAQSKELEKRLRAIEQQKTASQGADLLTGATDKGGVKFIAARVDVASPNDLRGLGADLLQKLGGDAVVVLGSAADADKVTVVALCSEGAIKQGHKAGDIVRDLTARLGGKGGGKPDFAMGGGKDAAGLKDALAELLGTPVAAR